MKTFAILNIVSLAIGVALTRFGMAFWQELEDFLGPILGPIVRGIFEPVYRTFENPTFRTQALSAIIWTAMIIGGLVFTIYEAPSFFNWIMGGKASTRPKPTPRSIQRTQRRVSERRSESQSKVDEERTRKQAIVDASGVRVQSKVSRKRESLLLTVLVDNESGNQIDMVVVDIDLPADINTAAGSFRMQRLGTIIPGEKETAEFKLEDRGGDVSAIRGHVEFLGASYEVSKIPLPAPEIT
ncbi:MAG: hypothetical protein ACFFFK_11060 [Candidatus Thorarchaeota archaeon]